MVKQLLGIGNGARHASERRLKLPFRCRCNLMRSMDLRHEAHGLRFIGIERIGIQRKAAGIGEANMPDEKGCDGSGDESKSGLGESECCIRGRQYDVTDACEPHTAAESR